MRTSQELYHQIRWDPRFRPADYRLGVQLRGGRIEEMPMLAFEPGGDIPWHRILYIRGPQVIEWDRRDGRDLLTPPAAVVEDGAWPLSVFSWNLCAGSRGLPRQERWEHIAHHLDPWPAEVVALQEVGDEAAALLPSGPWVWRAGELLLALAGPPRSLATVELSEGKPAMVADLGRLRVAVVHFTSDFRGDGRLQRRAQWEQLRPHLGEGAWLVAGDFNATDQELSDWEGHAGGPAGVDLTPPEPSFDPGVNPWARRTTRTGKAGRYQRFLASPGLWGRAVCLPARASDHDPLLLELEPRPGLTHASAWAIVPPLEVRQRADLVRAQHDPAYGRWPAHLNLLYPAPAEPDYRAVSRWLAEVERFRLRLEGLGRFSQGTLFWRAESSESLTRLRQRLGVPASEPFQPHLTLAKNLKGDPVGVWRAEFEVSHLVHLRQEKGVYGVAQAIPLRPPHRLYAAVAGCCGRPPAVVGSTCWGGEGDLDLVSFARAWPSGARRVGQMWRGQGYDLSLDERAVVDRDALCTLLAREDRWEGFAEEWRRLAQWLDLRGLKGQAWGWPGGLAWATLLARHQLDRAYLPVESPGQPPLDLTEHVPPELAEILRKECALRALERYLPSGAYLHLRDREGQGLGLVMDLLRQRRLWVRPVVRGEDCWLEWRGDATREEVAGMARARGLVLMEGA